MAAFSKSLLSSPSRLTRDNDVHEKRTARLTADRSEQRMGRREMRPDWPLLAPRYSIVGRPREHWDEVIHAKLRLHDIRADDFSFGRHDRARTGSYGGRVLRFAPSDESLFDRYQVHACRYSIQLSLSR